MAWGGSGLGHAALEDTTRPEKFQGIIELGKIQLAIALQVGQMLVPIPIMRVVGSFMTGLNVGQAVTGESLTGKELSYWDRGISAVLGLIGAIGLGRGYAAQVSGKGMTPPAGGGSGPPAGGGSTSTGTSGGWTRVTRLVSPEEAAVWKGRQSLPQPLGGSGEPARISVTTQGAPAFGGPGRVKMEFDVPSGALQPGGREDWRLIFPDTKLVPIRDLMITRPQ